MDAATSENILIVEDDLAIQEVLREVLSDETIHQVFLAQDGETALNMLQEVAFGLFLLDYRLPGMNGVEFIGHIRSIKSYKQTPVILMSAYLPSDVIKSHTKYLQKPFDLDDFLQMIEESIASKNALL